MTLHYSFLRKHHCEPMARANATKETVDCLVASLVAMTANMIGISSQDEGMRAPDAAQREAVRC
jgi:hypothetical protein